MRILILTDIHVGKTAPINGTSFIRQANTQALATLQTLVPALNTQKFDACMQLGDLLRDEGDKTVDLQSFESALQATSQLNPVPIHVPGNHDLHTFTAEEYLSGLAKYNFQQNTYGSVIQGKYKFIWLDFVREEHRKLLSPERLSWLKEELNYDGESLVFGHYPLKIQNVKGSVYFDGEDKKTGFAYDNAEEISQVLLDAPSRIRAYISGHVHWLGSYSIGEIPCFIAPSFTENIAAVHFTENNPAIYSTLEITEREIVFKSYSDEFCFATIER